MSENHADLAVQVEQLRAELRAQPPLPPDQTPALLDKIKLLQAQVDALAKTAGKPAPLPANVATTDQVANQVKAYAEAIADQVVSIEREIQASLKSTAAASATEARVAREVASSQAVAARELLTGRAYLLAERAAPEAVEKAVSAAKAALSGLNAKHASITPLTVPPPRGASVGAIVGRWKSAESAPKDIKALVTATKQFRADTLAVIERQREEIEAVRKKLADVDPTDSVLLAAQAAVKAGVQLGVIADPQAELERHKTAGLMTCSEGLKKLDQLEAALEVAHAGQCAKTLENWVKALPANSDTKAQAVRLAKRYEDTRRKAAGSYAVQYHHTKNATATEKALSLLGLEIA